MNNTKSPKNVSLKNQLELWLFCALIGAVAGALVWILLKIMAVGTEFLWKWLPEKISVPYYTIFICAAGAAIIGIFRKIFGDYPENLETVMEKVRAEKRYEYKNMLVMMVAALLPLLIGSSVGPEAGLTGIIVGLCYWAGDNLKFAKQNTRNYSQIGAAVSMSMLFHAPLFGIFRKIFGDYPEDLETVMGKVGTEKRYEYKNMLVMMVAALLPLLIGSSVGPEAGLTGIIVGLCYWAGDNLKFAGQNTRNYSKIGAAVSMSVLFHAPLFGIFEVEENSEEDLAALTKSSKLFIYGIALAAGTGIYAGLSALFGAGLSGFPSFDMVEIQRKDYLLMILYILCGLILAYFYQATHKLTGNISNRFPAVVREIFAGLCLGITGSFLPVLMFSGEEQMGTLMKTYTSYLPLALIGIAFFKLLLTNLCIQFGLKGGHFFPVIFAGVCMGYGVAMLTCGPDGGHVVFGAAIVTASLLGGIMKKPLAVTMLLFLCFPVKMFIWIFIAAVVGSKLITLKPKQEPSVDYSRQ